MRLWPRTNSLFYLFASVFSVVVSVLASCQQTPSHGAPRELLYVVDSDGNSENSHERLFAFDPERRSIVRTYPSGEHPDIALSPDGTRLYVASEDRNSVGAEGTANGKLEVIDTATGTIIASVADPQRWIGMGPFYGPEMALSADGRWLYIRKMAPGPQHTLLEHVAIFDTGARKFLADTIQLANGHISSFVTWPNGRTLSILCADPGEVRTVQFNDQGIPGRPAAIVIPHDWGRRRLGAGFVSGENELTVFMTDGHYSKVNVQTGLIIQEGDIAFSPPLTPAGWHPQTPGAEHVPSLGRRFVGAQIWESKGRVYVPLFRADLYMQAADAVAVLDSRSLQQLGFFELKSPSWHSSWNLFWSGAIGDGGTRLYVLGMEAKGGTLRVLGLPEGKEVDNIQGLGKTLSIVEIGRGN